MKDKIKCNNCIFHSFNEYYIYPMMFNFEKAVKIAKNHKDMKLKLNKNNKCKYRLKWNFKRFFKELFTGKSL